MVFAALNAASSVRGQTLRDTTICAGDFLRLQANQQYEIYQWSPRDQLEWAVFYTALVSPATTQEYVLRARRRLSEEHVLDGEFDANAWGSTSDLTRSGGSSFAPGTFSVVSSSAELRGDSSACPERSGVASDRFLAVFGRHGQTQRVWCQGVPVQGGEVYNFGATISTLHAASLGRIGFTVEGQRIGGYVTPYQVPCTWRSHGIDYAATETVEVEVCILQESPSGVGARTAIDAITFREYDTDFRDTVVVTVREAPPITRKTVEVCERGRYRFSELDLGPGESGTIGFPIGNGCDSLVEVTVRGVSVLRTADTLRGFCVGDWVDVGPTPFLARRDTTIFQVLRSAFGCDSIATTVVSVFDGSELSLQIDPPGCDAALTTATVTHEEGITFTWADGSGDVIRDDLRPGTPVTLTASDAIGCTAIFDWDVPTSASPSISVLEVTSPRCRTGRTGGISAELTVSDGESFSFSLTGPSGDESVIADTYLYADALAAGSYTLIAVDARGCSDTSTVVLAPDETVDLHLVGDTVALRGVAATYMVQGADAYETDRLKWIYSSGERHDLPPSSDAGKRLTFEPIGSGILQVELLLNSGCTELASLNVRVERDDSSLFPSAFSPNDDGINDVFAIVSHRGIDQLISLQIYNRWGAQIYDSKRVSSDSWSGEGAASGAYVYVAEVLYLDGEYRQLRGSIELLR